MFITLIVIVGLSVLILGHELGHFAAAKLFGLRVDEFGFGFPPRIFAWRPTRWMREGETLRQAQGETEYSFNWLPFGGFVKIAGENPENDERQATSDKEKERELFSFRPAWQRFLVIAAGVFANFMLGWWLLSAALVMGSPSAVVVAGVAPNSPAAEAGFSTGDVIQGFATAEEFIGFVNSNRGNPVDLKTLRVKGEVEVRVIPRVNPPAGEGALGVQLAETGEPAQGFFTALWEGLNRSALIIGLTFQGVWAVLKGLVMQGSVPEDVVGPLGIVAVAQRTGQIGFVYLLHLLSLISLNLAVINLIPFPALDGGRLLFIIVEKIKGSPIPHRMETLVNGIGFMLLLALIMLVTVRDAARMF